MGGRGLFTRFGVDRDQVPLFVSEASVGRQAARDRVVELPNYVYEEIWRDAGPMTHLRPVPRRPRSRHRGRARPRARTPRDRRSHRVIDEWKYIPAGIVHSRLAKSSRTSSREIRRQQRESTSGRPSVRVAQTYVSRRGRFGPRVYAWDERVNTVTRACYRCVTYTRRAVHPRNDALDRAARESPPRPHR